MGAQDSDAWTYASRILMLGMHQLGFDAGHARAGSRWWSYKILLLVIRARDLVDGHTRARH